MDSKEISVSHLEAGPSSAIESELKTYDSERAPEARGRDAAEVPSSYWRSLMFIGSYCAIGFGFMAATGGFALIAPLLGEINKELGPSENITWVALVYLLLQAVFFLVVGRLSDIFGRRWFFIIGSIIGLIGSIIGATAQSVNALIGAEVFCGLAAAFQISFFWVVAEIVPMKYRYIANSGAYAFTLPTNPLAAKIASAFQQTSVGWRGCLYFMIAVNFTSVLCWYFSYHPPTFKMLHRRTAGKDLLKRFDWIGLVLYAGSIFSFLLGLNWGGGVYPWNSGPVIGVLVGGAVGFIVFILWEIYLPISNAEPFLPLHLFKNLRYQACAWLTAVGAATYFGFSLIWPSAVAVLYTDLSIDKAGTISGLAAMGFVFGQIAGGVVGSVTGPRPGIIFCMCVSAPILAAAAANPLNMNLTMGLVGTGTLFIGMMEGMAICTTTFPLRSQEEIGTAGGLSGSIRSFGSVIAIAVLTTTLRNRLSVTIPANVVPAATKAGLPASSIPLLIEGLGGTIALNSTAIPGLTTQITEVAASAYKTANSQAYSTVFLVSLAFGGIGMILCWFVAQNDASLENYVAGHIHRTSEEKVLEEQTG